MRPDQLQIEDCDSNAIYNIPDDNLEINKSPKSSKTSINSEAIDTNGTVNKTPSKKVLKIYSYYDIHINKETPGGFTISEPRAERIPVAPQEEVKVVSLVRQERQPTQPVQAVTIPSKPQVKVKVYSQGQDKFKDKETSNKVRHRKSTSEAGLRIPSKCLSIQSRRPHNRDCSFHSSIKNSWLNKYNSHKDFFRKKSSNHLTNPKLHKYRRKEICIKEKYEYLQERLKSIGDRKLSFHSRLSSNRKNCSNNNSFQNLLRFCNYNLVRWYINQEENKNTSLRSYPIRTNVYKDNQWKKLIKACNTRSLSYTKGHPKWICNKRSYLRNKDNFVTKYRQRRYRDFEDRQSWSRSSLTNSTHTKSKYISSNSSKRYIKSKISDKFLERSHSKSNSANRSSLCSRDCPSCFKKNEKFLKRTLYNRERFYSDCSSSTSCTSEESINREFSKEKFKHKKPILSKLCELNQPKKINFENNYEKKSHNNRKIYDNEANKKRSYLLFKKKYRRKYQIDNKKGKGSFSFTNESKNKYSKSDSEISSKVHDTSSESGDEASIEDTDNRSEGSQYSSHLCLRLYPRKSGKIRIKRKHCTINVPSKSGEYKSRSLNPNINIILVGKQETPSKESLCIYLDNCLRKRFKSISNNMNSNNRVSFVNPNKFVPGESPISSNQTPPETNSFQDENHYQPPDNNEYNYGKTIGGSNILLVRNAPECVVPKKPDPPPRPKTMTEIHNDIMCTLEVVAKDVACRAMASTAEIAGEAAGSVKCHSVKLYKSLREQITGEKCPKEDPKKPKRCSDSPSEDNLWDIMSKFGKKPPIPQVFNSVIEKVDSACSVINDTFKNIPIGLTSFNEISSKYDKVLSMDDEMDININASDSKPKEIQNILSNIPATTSSFIATIKAKIWGLFSDQNQHEKLELDNESDTSIGEKLSEEESDE